MDTRAWRNPYHDYDGSPAFTQALFDSHGKLTSEFAQRLSSKISELLAVMENGLKSADPRDCTSYTGWAGIALLYLHLHNVFKDPSLLQKALDYVNHSLKCLTRRHDVTFLCGDAGPLAIAAVVYHRLQRVQETDECINRLLQFHQNVVKGAGGLPDELLYGRMGYLYSLVFVNQQLGQDRIPLQYIQQISEAVLVSGEHLSRKFRVQNHSPLMYEWYQEQYVGAAHGLAGIFYYLMQAFGVPQYLVDALQCGEVVWHCGLLKKGYGLCHGAAGNAYAFLALYRQTQDPKHLYRACMFADWCMNYGKHGCRTPDTPFSLFEGMAGTIYFLADLLQPMKARFPAFEV
uniref:Glutathione S-transferase LANCL1 n=1 Tax=Dicentrarchus labrax TaxID=13489 RepID=A0A8P4GTT2_DICLA